MRKVTHYFPYNQIYLHKKHTKKHTKKHHNEEMLILHNWMVK